MKLATAKKAPEQLKRKKEELRNLLRSAGAPLRADAALQRFDAALKVGKAEPDANFGRAVEISQWAVKLEPPMSHDYTAEFSTAKPVTARWRSQQTGEGHPYDLDQVTGQIGWEMPAVLRSEIRKSRCAVEPEASVVHALKHSGEVTTSANGRVVVRALAGRVGVLDSLPQLLPLGKGTVAHRGGDINILGSANSGCYLIKKGNGIGKSNTVMGFDSPEQAYIDSILSQGYTGKSLQSSFMRAAAPDLNSIDLSSKAPGPPILISTTDDPGSALAAANRCEALRLTPLLLGAMDAAFLRSAMEALYATTTRPQTLITTDDDGSTWRPYLRPRTRPASKSPKGRAHTPQAPRGAQQPALPQLTAGDAARFAQQQAEVAAFAQAQAQAQAEAAAQAAAQAEAYKKAAAEAQAQAKLQSARTLLSLMAQTAAKDMASLGAAALDDTPLMHSGMSSIDSGEIRTSLHEPLLELAFMYEFQYNSMPATASQIEPRTSTAQKEMLAAADKEAQKEAGGIIGRGVRIRGSGTTGYSFYDMTQLMDTTMPNLRIDGGARNPSTLPMLP